MNKQKTKKKYLSSAILLMLLQIAAVGCMSRTAIDYEEIIAERALALSQSQTPENQTIIISELSLWNTTQLQTLEGTYPKWIELQNVSETAQNLRDWYLAYFTNDGQRFRYTAFPDLEIGAHDFLLLVFTSQSEELPIPAVRFVADLPDAAVRIELVNQSSRIVDSFEMVTPLNDDDFTFSQVRDISNIRIQINPSLIVQTQTPTPGMDNSVNIPKPIFSRPSGFHEKPEIHFDTSLLPEGYTIRYTLNDNLRLTEDGLLNPLQWEYPTQITGILYQVPVTLEKTTSVKARVYSPTGACSEEVSRIFFVDERTALPVVSLTINPFDLWDIKWGIYRNYSEKAYRLAKFEYFPSTEVRYPYISQDYLFRIYGSSSKAFPSKSFALYAKRPGSTKRISNLFFSGSAREIDDLYSIILRNSGGDFVRTMLKDVFITDLAANFNLEKQDGQPAVVYINGQYWGIMNIREKINEEFLKDHLLVDHDGVDIIEGSYKASMTANEGIIDGVEKIYELLEKADPKFDFSYRQFEELIDIENFINYIIIQSFSNNTDWPWSNVKFWRDREDNGKWRFILYDTDAGFDTTEYWTTIFPDPDDPKGLVDFNTIEYIGRGKNNDIISKLFHALLRNKTFHARFLSLYKDALEHELTTEKLLERIEFHAERISAEIPRHTKRWSQIDPITGKSLFLSRETWETEVQVIRDFAMQRPRMVLDHLESFMADHPPREAHRIENGNFEDTDVSMWNLRWSAGSVSQSILAADESSVGYFKILEGKTNPWDSVAFVYDKIYVRENEHLTLTFDIRSDRNFTSPEYIRVYLFDTETNKEILSKDIKAVPEWKTISVKGFNSGPAISSARLQLRVGTLRLGREIFIDNFILEGEVE